MTDEVRRAECPECGETLPMHQWDCHAKLHKAKPAPTLDELQKEIAQLRAQLVWEFDQEMPTVFTQGDQPLSELHELVTADRCNGMITKITELMDIVEKQVVALRLLDELCYVPGLRKCDKCQCRFVSAKINETGHLYKYTADDASLPCPECGQSQGGKLQRVTEREVGNTLCDQLTAATELIIELKKATPNVSPLH